MIPVDVCRREELEKERERELESQPALGAEERIEEGVRVGDRGRALGRGV